LKGKKVSFMFRVLLPRSVANSRTMHAVAAALQLGWICHTV